MNSDTARFGERVAAWFLESRGARIVGRNVRIGHDEIDLVAHPPPASDQRQDLATGVFRKEGLPADDVEDSHRGCERIRIERTPSA